MNRITTTIAALVLFASCAGRTAPPPDPVAQTIAQSQLMVAEAYQLERLRKVNENWSADCTTDAVTNVSECRAATFGQSMDHRGQGYGDKNLPFHVYFIDQRGPFLRMGFNTYPGRTPTVRLDDGEPVHLAEREQQLELVGEMINARTARARFHVWPTGSEDMIINLQGFGEAWEKLLGYVSGDEAPSDRAGNSVMRARAHKATQEENEREDNSFNQLLKALR
jgi:hypothetical protein